MYDSRICDAVDSVMSKSDIRLKYFDATRQQLVVAKETALVMCKNSSSFYCFVMMSFPQTNPCRD